jgi:hypothetical protein
MLAAVDCEGVQSPRSTENLCSDPFHNSDRLELQGSKCCTRLSADKFSLALGPSAWHPPSRLEDY